MGRKTSTESINFDAVAHAKPRHSKRRIHKEEAKQGDIELNPMEIAVKEGKKETKKREEILEMYTDFVENLLR